MAQTTEQFTIRDAISQINEQTRDLLPNKDADTIRIMEHVAEMNETGMLQSLDQPLSQKQAKRLHETISRIKQDEPLEYITGKGDFQGRRFHVSKDTLIPRPETELLVDMAVSAAMAKSFNEKRAKKKLGIVDVGTGSGCIIISIALMIKEPAAFYASDISPKALTVAQKNIAAYSLNSEIKTLHQPGSSHFSCPFPLRAFAQFREFVPLFGEVGPQVKLFPFWAW